MKTMNKLRIRKTEERKRMKQMNTEKIEGKHGYIIEK
jgi:hypothetical protein